MRLASAVGLAVLAALANGCTIHVAQQPAAAEGWSAPPPVAVAPSRPHPVTPASPSVAKPRPRVASSTRPSAYGRVTTPPSTKPAPIVRAEPRPTQPVTSAPVVSKPRPAQPPVADKPKGRYPFRLTRPEPRRPEISGDRAANADRRVRPPIAATR